MNFKGLLISVLSIGLPVCAMAANGHFKEVGGTAAIEVENFVSNNNGVVTSDALRGTAGPISGKGLAIICENRGNTSVKYKVDFTSTGVYKVYILAAGNGLGGNNFNVFLGKNPGAMRSMNSKQNCTSEQNASCPNWEATVSDDRKMSWRGGGESNSYQCISGRGCKAGNWIGKWNITTPGTYEFGIHTGDEPFHTHESTCSDPNKFALVIDKFVFTKEGKPSGQGPTAVLSDGTPIDPGPGGGTPVTGDCPATASNKKLLSVTDFSKLSVNGFVPYYKDNTKLAIDAAQYKDKWAAAEMVSNQNSFIYDVKINTNKESDGESSYKLFIDGKQIGSTFQNRSGSDGQVDSYTWSSVSIVKGSVIQVQSNTHSNNKVPEGNAFGYSRGRWESIELIAKSKLTSCSSTIIQHNWAKGFYKRYEKSLLPNLDGRVRGSSSLNRTLQTR